MALLQLGSSGWVQEKYVFILLAAAVLLVALLGAIYYVYTSRVRKGFAIPKLPPGSVILVEGPLDSRKGPVCNAFLKGIIEGGGKAAVISPNPSEQVLWFEKNMRKEQLQGLMVTDAERGLTELGVLVSNALGLGAGAIYMPVLSVLLVDERLESVADFIRFNAEKARKRGAYLIFTIDPDATAKASVTSIELLADCVVELRTEGGEFVRVKKMPGGEADLEWKPL